MEYIGIFTTAADRVPNVGMHSGQQLGGRPLAPRHQVPGQGQHQGGHGRQWCINSHTRVGVAHCKWGCGHWTKQVCVI